MADRPWLSHYDPGVPAELTASNDGLYELLSASVQRFPDTCAISYFGRELSYWRLKNMCDAFAAAMMRRHIGPGQRVAVLLPNCPQFVIAVLGTVRAGAAVMPLPPDLPSEALRELLKELPCDVAVVLDTAQDAIKHSLPKLSLVVTSPRDYLPPPPSGIKASEPLQLPRSPEEPDVPFLPLVKRSRAVHLVPVKSSEAALFHVADAEVARACVFSSAALAANAQQLALWPGRILKQGHETLLAAHPLHRIEGMTGCLGLALASAATLILTSRVRTEDIQATLTTCSPSILVAPAALFAELAKAPPPPRRSMTRSLRWALSTYGPLEPDHRLAFEEHSDCRVVEALCLPEAGFVCANPLLQSTSLQLPLPGTDVHIVDSHGRNVRYGHAGHLAIRGPQLPSGWMPEPKGRNPLVRGRLLTPTAATMLESGAVMPGEVAEPALSGNIV